MSGRYDIEPGVTREDRGLVHLETLYHHTLEARALAELGERRARTLNDEELAELFVSCRAQSEQTAERIRQMMAARREDTPEDRDTVTEASMESFPASDPPAY